MNLVLWWHMHQPDYRSMDGEFMLPWVYLHAIKDYADMPLHIMSHAGMKANINITPILVDQWQDYNLLIKKALEEKNSEKASAIMPDKFLRPLLLKELDEETKAWMAAHYKWVNYDRLVSRFENYKRLYDFISSENNLFYLNDSYYFDLCVWFHLAWCGEWMKRFDPVINYFLVKGFNFTYEDRRLLLKRLLEWMRYGITLYGFPSEKNGPMPPMPADYPGFIDKEKLKELNGRKKGEYNISISPHYHPIIPLLIDIHSGAISAQMTGIHYEPVDIGIYSCGHQRARRHMEPLKNYFRQDAPVKALWPSEGAISSESLDLFDEYGIDICASGEEILSSSLGMDSKRPVFMEGRNIIPLYRPYVWKNTRLKLIFRDSGLSDLIGFTYATWRGDDAARDFVEKLHLIDDFDKKATVSVILDGENAWEYYYENGYYFLNDLYSMISESVRINPLLLSEISNTGTGQGSEFMRLDTVIPGSWVNGNLRMWVGEEQKNKAWMLLEEAKNELLFLAETGKIDAKKVEAGFKSLMAAEGSDWFWWLGKESPLFSQSSMEKIFRQFLMNIYKSAGVEPPRVLFDSLSSTNVISAEMGGIMKRGRE